jgi:hypothetical protein
MRCPNIQPNASYFVAVVGSFGPWQRQGRLTEMALVHVQTSSAAPHVPVVKVEVGETGVDYFDLRTRADAAGQLYYAVAYSSVQAAFFQSYLLTFKQGGMPARQVVEHALHANSSSKQDGIVAAGVIEVQGDEWIRKRVQPSCQSSACDVRENFRKSQLSPATEYKVFFVFGDPLQDPAGTVLAVAAADKQHIWRV